MALVRWSPFQELADMRREMQSLGTLMSSRLFPFAGEDKFVPAMDVITKGDDLIVKLELPGMDVEKDVEITVDGDLLHISGKRTVDREEERGGYHVHEMRYGTFSRTFPLPDGVDAEAVTAAYKDGILEVTIAGGAKQMEQPEAPPSRRIAITKQDNSGQPGIQQDDQQGS
jgi:HSP20 family protein